MRLIIEYKSFFFASGIGLLNMAWSVISDETAQIVTLCLGAVFMLIHLFIAAHIVLYENQPWLKSVLVLMKETTLDLGWALVSLSPSIPTPLKWFVFFTGTNLIVFYVGLVYELWYLAKTKYWC